MSEMNGKNRKNEIKLKALSYIDEDIIDKNTEKRIKRYNAICNIRNSGSGAKYKKTVIIAVAAALILALMCAILVPLLMKDPDPPVVDQPVVDQHDEKQVPVYKGMSVSGDNIYSTLEADNSLTLDFLASGGNDKDNGNNSGGDKHNGNANAENEKDPLGIVGSGETAYFAKKNEDIYITVHIENPDEFEIVSFTLNGVKYTNYMFEEGSDLEHLVLKVNVGEAQGYVGYTIDAIKYIEGTEIKDVRIDGDKTVKIGVYPEAQPTATVTNENIGFGSVSFEVDIADVMGLISKGDSIKAELYDADGELIDTKEMTNIGKNEIVFEGLDKYAEYTYKIIAAYDAIDGQGIKEYTLYTRSIRTTDIMVFGELKTDFTEISFTLQWVDDFEPKELTSLKLYRGEELIKELATDATSVSDLTSDTEYTLVATYLNGEKTETVKIDFKTDARTVEYKVNHYLQNIEDDEYTIEETETLMGTENTTVPPSVKKFDHYISPAAVTKKILPDGSLVIDYYYEAIKYKTTFVTNGGNEIAVIEKKYGESVILPNAVKSGFTFGGWYTDANLTNEFTATAQGNEKITLYAYWEEETKPCEFTFNGGAITKFTGSSSDVVIPSYIGGDEVTSIGKGAFRECSSLESIIIPDSVIRIGYAAFDCCDSLESLTIGSGVKIVDALAFMSCESLENLYITDLAAYCNIDFIGIGVGSHPMSFADNLYLNNILITDLVIPEGVTSIRAFTFDSCENIKSVTIPDSVMSIGDRAFSDCKFLESVNIGKGVKSIGVLAFSSCSRLKSLTIPDGVTSIGANAFLSSGIESIIIPDSMTSIGDSAFSSCRKLKSVTISNGVTSIGNSAFSYCEALNSVTIPDSVKTIGEWAFNGCYELTSVTIGKGVTRIEEGAFSSLSHLTDVYYRGSEEEWNSIRIKDVNDDLKNATIHYNYNG